MTTNDTTSASFSLKSPVGTVGGPLTFALTDHVFTSADMRPEGKQARENIKQMFASPILCQTVTPPHWNTSTLPDPTPLDTSLHQDNKYYAALQTAYLVNKAQHRVELIRAGKDPDADPLSIQPRWNVSSKLEDDEGHLHLPDKLAHLLAHKTHVPIKQYVTPLERQTQLQHRMRQGKREAEEQQEQKQEKEQAWAEWEKKEQWNANPQPIKANTEKSTSSILTQQSTQSPSHIQIQTDEEPLSQRQTHRETERQSYESQTLQAFLASSPRNTSASSSSSSYTSSLSSSSALSASASTSVSLLNNTTAYTRRYRSTPVAIYSHPGHYDWVIRQSSTGDGSEESVKQWSCCHSTVATARGCVKIQEAVDKVLKVPVTSSSSPTRKSDGTKGKVVRYSHSGVYEQCRGEEGRQWSCCSAAEYTARGCVGRVISDELKWTYE